MGEIGRRRRRHVVTHDRMGLSARVSLSPPGEREKWWGGWGEVFLNPEVQQVTEKSANIRTGSLLRGKQVTATMEVVSQPGAAVDEPPLGPFGPS